MGLYVKKTVTGYRESQPVEATHYIQTVGEFKNSILDLERTRTELKNTLDGIPLREAEIRESYKLHERQLREQHELQISEELDQIKRLQEELDKIASAKTASDELNRNLIRIMRERANATRGISPKAKEDGYLLLSIRQVRDFKEIRYDWELYNKQSPTYRKKHRFTPIERMPVKVWKLLIQTPYDIGLSINAIQEQVLGDLKAGILADLGVSDIEEHDFMSLENDFPNVAYKYFFQANLKAALWEIELFTMADITVPDCRRQYVNTRRTHGSKNTIK